MSHTSSTVSEVIPSSPGGREFCSTAYLGRVADSGNEFYLGISPSGDAGYTGTVDSLEVCFDGPVSPNGYTIQFYLSVVNVTNHSLVYENLQYFRAFLVDPTRPVFFKFGKPLNFVVPPGYFLCCHYRVGRQDAVFLSTANVRWRSYNVV